MRVRNCVTFICIMVTSDAFLKSITFRNSAAPSQLMMTTTNQFPISSGTGHRHEVRKIVAAAAIFSTFGFSRRANAGLFTSAEQDQIEQISSFQRPIYELLDQLRPAIVPNAVGVYVEAQVLKGSKEDSDVVLNYLETYIKPCQSKMLEAAPRLKLSNPTDQARIEVLPLLMTGHILELSQAIKEMKAESQAREVEEVIETLSEYLKLASSKYTVTPYVTPRALTEKDYLGPLGCEFWGKKRIEGSNACAEIPQPAASK